MALTTVYRDENQNDKVVHIGAWDVDANGPLPNSYSIDTVDIVTLPDGSLSVFGSSGRLGIANLREYGEYLGRGEDSILEDTKAFKWALAEGNDFIVPLPQQFYGINQTLISHRPHQRVIGGGANHFLGFSGDSVFQQADAYLTESLTDNTMRKSCLLKFYAPSSSDRFIQTRRRARTSSGDAQDPAVRAAWANHADGFHMSGIALMNNTDFTDTDKDNFGEDWDYMFLNACRAKIKIEDCAFYGYTNNSVILHDVTRAHNLPQYTVPTALSHDGGGITLEAGFFPRGSDGCVYDNVLVAGGPWGVQILGPKRNGANYVDPVEGTVADWRGSSGNSDLWFNRLHVDNHHHSNYRFYDGVDPDVFNKTNMLAEGIYSEDAAGGVWIDCSAGANGSFRRASKIEFDGQTRIYSREVFSGFRLGEIDALRIEYPHIEGSNEDILRRVDIGEVTEGDLYNVGDYSYGEYTANADTAKVFIANPASYDIEKTRPLFDDIIEDNNDGGYILIGDDKNVPSKLGKILPKFDEAINISAIDVNTLEGGFYQVSNPTNGPSGSSACYFFVIVFNDDNAVQFATTRSGTTVNDDRVFFRKKVGGTWRAWIPFEVNGPAGDSLTELTISGGAITVGSRRAYKIATEASVSTDDLVTINGGTFAGQKVMFFATDSVDDVVFKDAGSGSGGNIYCGADFTFTHERDLAEFVYDGTNWLAMTLRDND